MWSTNQQSYRYNTTAQLECADGYFSEIGKTARCAGEGTWVDVPRCMREYSSNAYSQNN